jgi:hypothetical protein
VDEKFVECNIPSGISVSDETHRGANVRPLFNNQFFVLDWSDNYSIKMNGIEILGLTNQRQWSVNGLRSAHVHVLDR